MLVINNLDTIYTFTIILSFLSTTKNLIDQEREWNVMER